MERSLTELEAIVRNRICTLCTERTSDGQCGMETPADCALFRLFPQVAQAIRSVSSDDICDYIAAIRANVCSVCHQQDADGSCETRQMVQCALDSYLLLVVDAIEEATGKTFDRNQLGGMNAGQTASLGPQIRL